MTDKLFHALNMAAGELPPGWIVELCVERGAGWVELYDPDGDRHEMEDVPDATLAEQVDAAVLEALRASGLAPRASQETLADRQREPDAVEKQALYGRMDELYRRDPGTSVTRCTCKDFPGADECCMAHSTANRGESL